MCQNDQMWINETCWSHCSVTAVIVAVAIGTVAVGVVVDFWQPMDG